MAWFSRANERYVIGSEGKEKENTFHKDVMTEFPRENHKTAFMFSSQMICFLFKSFDKRISTFNKKIVIASSRKCEDIPSPCENE
ncbi:CLUMA_CG003342, isoform A [Clunio marinus]|uniref:CLUMA_CG003342, isoform A n=1 Tax=Clunio marinus TaxID=568069 RepID=A0A1J1HQB2_9DIPT|nr:CLUMA_CG003342, isoform A [Clunio marinus]